jgi:hypothetical protein
MFPSFTSQRVLLSTVCFFALLLACSSDAKNEGHATRPPSSDITALAKRVKLTDLPQEAVFQVSPMGSGDGMFGPTDYSLIAALRYEPATLARLKNELTRQNTGQRPVWLPERPDWFPQTLSSKIKRCTNNWCIEGEEYSGRPFLKGGFVTGTLVVPHNSEFVILLLRT